MPRQATKSRPPPVAPTRYEDDLYTWVQEQVALLRAGRIAEIDAGNIAEELADLGKAEQRRLTSAFAVVIHHMLKWDYQPDRRSRSWALSIHSHRLRIVRLLRDNPGLKGQLAELVESAYVDGRARAYDETDLYDGALPARCPYTLEEIMEREYAVDPPPQPKRRRKG